MSQNRKPAWLDTSSTRRPRADRSGPANPQRDPRDRRARQRRLAALVTVTLVALSAAACSSSDNSSGGSKSSAASRAFLSKATTIASDAASPIKAVVPTSGPKALKARTLILMPCSAAAQGCQTQIDWAKKAATAIGWKTIEIDPAGDPAKMAAGVERAVTLRANAMFIVGIDAGTIQAPLKAARASGMKIVCFACINKDGLYNAVFPAQSEYASDGYNLAAQAYVNAKGHLRMILVKDSEFSNVVLRVNGAEKFIKDCQTAGGDCKIVDTQNVVVSNLDTAVPQQLVSSARSHPDWNALWMPYDAMTTFVVPALKSAGLATAGKYAYGLDPIPLNVDWIRQGNVEAATVASPYRWIAFAGIDALNRAMAGQEIPDAGVKDRLIIQDNAPASGQTYLGDNDVTSQYLKLWGVK